MKDGMDSSLNVFDNGFDHYDRTGICFAPFISSYYGEAKCGARDSYEIRDFDLYDPVMRLGCPCNDPDVAPPDCDATTTRTQCIALNYTWVTNATTKATCESSPTACFVSGLVSTFSFSKSEDFAPCSD